MEGIESDRVRSISLASTMKRVWARDNVSCGNDAFNYVINISKCKYDFIVEYGSAVFENLDLLIPRQYEQNEGQSL